RHLEHVDSPEAVGGHDEQSALSRAKGRTSPLSAAALSIEAQARRTDHAAAGCCASCTSNAKISSAGMDGTKRLNLRQEGLDFAGADLVFRPAPQAAARACRRIIRRGSAGGECG